MTSRLGQPNLPADDELQRNLEADRPESFVMIAGAGSGKTTSLIKALHTTLIAHGPSLSARGRQVACITYTEIAVGEILEDVGPGPLLHVSTVHSFLWSLIRPLQSELRVAVGALIAEKIVAGKLEVEKAKADATKDKRRAVVARLERDLQAIDLVKLFTYGMGSKYADGILGHEDVISIACDLLSSHALMRTICAQRFPIVFVDESQDTFPRVVDALRAVADDHAEFCLGYFGDPMQRIYPTGIGEIDVPDSWLKIEKPENFRSPAAVLRVINKIREEGDGDQQTHGLKFDEVGGPLQTPEGSAVAVVLPTTSDRSSWTDRIRTSLAAKLDDPGWTDPAGDVKALVITHRMEAERLGFGELYGIFHTKTSTAMSTGFDEGTGWTVRPVVAYLLPMLRAHAEGDDSETMRLIREGSAALLQEALEIRDAADILEQLEAGLVEASDSLAEGTVRIRELVQRAIDAGLIIIDERLGFELSRDFGAVDDDDFDGLAVQKYLDLSCRSLVGYGKFLDRESPFATHQGIKGAEFRRVMVVLDDAASTHYQFSYDKLFGLTPLSKADLANRVEGKETVVERTRRLLYVCCSRATASLAVVLFAEDPELAKKAVEESGIFDKKFIFEAGDLGWDLA